MLIQEKHKGAIKGRAWADDWKQGYGSQNKDTAPPTVELELILITSAIDVHKRRDVAVVEIPGALLTTDINKDIIMVLKGILAEIMVKTKPIIYWIFVMIENKQTVLYVKLQKSLYGCLRSAILFYEKLVSDLNTRGFFFFLLLFWGGLRDPISCSLLGGGIT